MRLTPIKQLYFVFGLQLILLSHFFGDIVTAGDASKPHPHRGIIKPLTDKSIKFSLSQKELDKINEGKSVMKTVKNTLGKTGGQGFAVQDVNAPPNVCLDVIADLKSYVKHVPSVKKVTIYSTSRKFDGTQCSKAQFDVRVFGIGFKYFLNLQRNNRHMTYTWTLDYDRLSDFDDNVGRWQVMRHPSKQGWSRILYCADVRLPSWLPKPAVMFLTKTAILESTAWVKTVSEKKAEGIGRGGLFGIGPMGGLGRGSDKKNGRGWNPPKFRQFVGFSGNINAQDAKEEQGQGQDLPQRKRCLLLFWRQ
jgi:hypothetical protein